VPEFTVTMVRAAGITEEERRHRLHQAYTILLQAARQKETGESDDLGGQTLSPAVDAPAQEQDAQSEV
jgi:hypothetical protein